METRTRGRQPPGVRCLRSAGLPPALLAMLALALLGLSGCGRLRSSARTGPSSASSRLPALTVGEPVLEQLRAGAKSANLVILVLDAARADHIGCYGYPRGTTPNIDALTGESVIFRNHFCAFPSTKASTATLLTGLYPDALRFGETGALDPGVFTLEKGMEAAGFRTALFSSNLVASPETGIGADFEEVYAKLSKPHQVGKESIRLPDDELWRTPQGLTQVFAKWLAGQRNSRFFAYCHFLPPHNPYNAPEAVQQLFSERPPISVGPGPFEFPEVGPPHSRPLPYSFQQWLNLYDANMWWADWGVGEVVRLLREQGVLDNTLLVITSDHGEAFGEHGYIYHAHAVYDEMVHIPLLIRFPGQRRLTGEVTALTQTVDLLPTVFDLYQIPYPRESVQGHSLLSLLDGENAAVRDYVFATCAEPWPSYLVRDASWSLILYRGGKLRALYDLRADPGQRHNAMREHPATGAKMALAFERFARTQRRTLAEFLSPDAVAPRAATAKAPQGQLSDQARRELRALGYLE